MSLVLGNRDAMGRREHCVCSHMSTWLIFAAKDCCLVINAHSCVFHNTGKIKYQITFN